MNSDNIINPKNTERETESDGWILSTITSAFIHAIILIAIGFAWGVNEEPKVRFLNIKLGGGQNVAEHASKARVKSKYQKDKRYNKKSSKQIRQEKISTKSPYELHYNKPFSNNIRQTARNYQMNLKSYKKQQVSNSSVSLSIGNSANKDAELLKRYTQMLSNWYETNKIIPRSGKGRVSVIIMIKRDGNLLNAKIEKSSGNAGIDEAALKMAWKSSPFPAVPTEYKVSGRYLQFRIISEFVAE